MKLWRAASKAGEPGIPNSVCVCTYVLFCVCVNMHYPRHPKLSLCVYVCAVLCVSVYTHYSVYVLMNMCVCVSVPMKR